MTRILSAAVLVALVVVTLYWLPWWATLVLATLAAALAGSELAGIAASAGAPVPSGIAALGAAMTCVAFVMGEPESPIFREHALPALLMAAMLALALAALAEGTPSPASLTRAATLGFTPLYIGMPLGIIAWVGIVAGPVVLTWLLIVMVASDTGQYYAGRLLGRRKLAPAISPAKTVEGAIGGLVAAGIVGGVLAGRALGAAPEAGVVLGMLLAGSGICGDLFESLLKRSAGVKDSSSMIPGHGGVLDRIDSYLFAAPLFYLYVRLVVA